MLKLLPRQAGACRLFPAHPHVGPAMCSRGRALAAASSPAQLAAEVASETEGYSTSERDEWVASVRCAGPPPARRLCPAARRRCPASPLAPAAHRPVERPPALPPPAGACKAAASTASGRLTR